MSHGAEETESLKANIQDQLSRLLLQLQDLEELRAELDEDEYEEVKRDSILQLEEFDQQLKKLMDGDMSLVSSLGAIKLAIRAAISASTSEVMGSFARREPVALRARLAKLAEQNRMKQIPDAAYKAGVVEVLVALKRLGEELNAEEKAFLEGASGDVKKRFAAAGEEIGEQAVLSLAAKAGTGGAGR